MLWACLEGFTGVVLAQKVEFNRPMNIEAERPKKDKDPREPFNHPEHAPVPSSAPTPPPPLPLPQPPVVLSPPQNFDDDDDDFPISTTPKQTIQNKQPPPAMPVKPPFSQTPLGKILHPNDLVSDEAKTVPTPHSILGGYAGNTRSNGQKLHQGLDLAATAESISRYTGPTKGIVTKAGFAFDDKKQSLGVRVTIYVKTDSGDWETTTMHHKLALVKVGDVVAPGQAIALGGGEGDQFKSNEAGASHVHWEVRHNGVAVDPLSGTVLPAKPMNAIGNNATSLQIRSLREHAAFPDTDNTISSRVLPIETDAPQNQEGSSSVDPNDPVVGTWDWGGGQRVTIDSNGSCRSTAGSSGRWSAVENRQWSYRLSWKEGWIDSLTLSIDRNTLTGTNQYGGIPVGRGRVKE